MTKTELYRAHLRTLAEWEPYLLAQSGLPGPRGNLELAQAAVDEGDEAHFRRWLAYDAARAPTNTPGEFLAMCGTIGLGKLLVEGRPGILADLRALAADERWRVREGVAMALQRGGDAGMPALLDAMHAWSHGSYWEQRAVVAGLCEPRLLAQPAHAQTVLAILDDITCRLPQAADRRAEAFRVLRQALGYGWSVAAVALPAQGLPLMEQHLRSADRDVQWIMRENLKKNRLTRLDPGWVARWQGGS